MCMSMDIDTFSAMLISVIIMGDVITILLFIIFIDISVDKFDDYVESFKDIECEVLKQKIYEKDFEMSGWDIIEEAEHEYEWRCEK